MRGQVKRLTEQLLQLQQDLAHEENQKWESQLKLKLVQHWADGLQFYFTAVAAHSGEPAAPALQALQQQEHELLRQFAVMAPPQVPGALGGLCAGLHRGPDLLTLGVTTLSPPSDPMQYFRGLVAQASMPEAAHMTAEQLAGDIQRCCSHMGILLSKLQTGVQYQEAAKSLKVAWDRHLHLLLSLMLLGRQPSIAKCLVYDLDTLRPDPANMQSATERTLMVATHLGLTDQQQAAIATGVEFYLHLLESTSAEEQALQAALAQAEADDSSGGGGDSGGSSGSRTSADHRLPTTSSELVSRAQQLEERQRLCQRLQHLLQKENTLQLLFVGHLVGSLSYEQLATAAVLVWPSILRLSHLGLGIQQLYRQKTQRSKPRAAAR